MAIELIVLSLLLFLFLGALIFGFVSEQKIFLLGAFLLLMFSGILIQSAGGVIVGHYYDVEGVYTASTVSLADPVMFLFSQTLFWVGLVVSAWLGLVAAFGSNKTSAGSPFNW